jgi:hypothetical protein
MTKNQLVKHHSTQTSIWIHWSEEGRQLNFDPYSQSRFCALSVCIFFALLQLISDGIFDNTARDDRLFTLHLWYQLVETGPEYGMNKQKFTRDVSLLNSLDKRALFIIIIIIFIQLSFLKFLIS